LKKDDDDEYSSGIKGSPWVESTGASKQDVWYNVNLSYSHFSSDRNKIISANLGTAHEFDYQSYSVGGGFSHLFNEKNTEVGVKANVYFDKWRPMYPTELDSYFEAGMDLNAGFFKSVQILNQQGEKVNKKSPNIWRPFKNTLVDNENRNTYALSFSFSQITTKKSQLSIFMDIINQRGWLANPMQRVYFKDRANFYIGEKSDIVNYTNRFNNGVFHLADDIERLPSSRFKLPIGARFNYYINEHLVIRTYYRWYSDDWGIRSNTLNIEAPIKFNRLFAIIPSYRFYNQTASDYFAGYEQHVSTSRYYTSDYDLSKFSANQFSIGFRYSDVLTKHKLWKLCLKSINLRYGYYQRSNGLESKIISLGIKLTVDK
jgi:uncharacterized protein Veg